MAITSIKSKNKDVTTPVAIPEPNMQHVVLPIVGTAPLMVNRFSAKAKAKMREDQAAGSTAKTKKKREAKDFEQNMRDALYYCKDDGGWYGIHAGSFRAAAISACRLVGFKMTLAKLSIFVEADGFDEADATPLVRIISDLDPELHIGAVRNATGVIDLRARPMWRSWGANLRVRYDGDQFTDRDIANLFARVGQQVGVSEGRPDSKSSIGLGFGLFKID